jgi:epoxyqueuosine reductase
VPRPEQPREIIRDKAIGLGFDAVGFAAPGSVARAGARFRRFLADGWHGEMAWLEVKAERRASPMALWPEVRSVIMLGQNYGPGHDPLAVLAEAGAGAISVYAQGRDYHDVVKSRLKALGRWLGAEFDVEVKVFVDTAPVLEKPLAEAAGLGWQGKHTNLVSRDFGSWLFLGAVFTTLALDPDAGEADHCGSCRRCLEVCPTDAFPAPYRLDARRCISYLTIEHRGQIPRQFRPLMGNRIFGCDDCLSVCPWNKYAQAAREARLSARPELTAAALHELAALDDAAFRRLFTKSPVKRLGRDRFVRNVLVAIGNSADAALAAAAESRLGDASGLVRGMAVWALSRLLDAEAFGVLKARHHGAEADSDVRAEWDIA